MHLLILEYVTAGGLGPAAEQPLCAEADTMALALARDFGRLQGVAVALPRCPTLPWPSDLPASVQRLPGLAQEAFVDLVAKHDAVLLVAPETAHILHALALQVESLGRPLLGPSAAAIACAGDKWRCFLALDAAGVPQLPTFPAASDWPDLAGPWVLKPADGCGCEGVRRFPDRGTARAAAARLAAAAGDGGNDSSAGGEVGTPAWLAQPWQAGVAASLTLLSGPSTVELLAVNRQRIQVDELGQVSLAEVETGTLTDSDGRLAALARRVHAAIPGLHGIWGIDVLLQADRDCVVEVNPRITSAYPGLAAVLQDNPARRWLAAAEHLPAAMRDPAAAIGMRTDAAALSPRPAGSPAPAAVLGWDIGGAHLKVAALDRHGRLIDVVQLPCALWQGMDRLEPLLAELCGRWGAPQRHALTMSGEMVDLFPDRASGVAALIACFERHAGGVPISVYGGPAGWVATDECADRWAAIASANWLSMGDWAAMHLPAGVVLDLGSTTCDALCFHGGRARPSALGDAARLTSRELVYTGIARTPLMALAHQVNLGGRPTGVMAEWFASSADVYRILGELPDDADLHPSADGGPKTLEGSVRRLARMVGCDGPEWALATWRDVARQFRTVQLERIDEALALALERLPPSPVSATVVVAGAGAFLARETCAHHPVQVQAFGRVGGLLPEPPVLPSSRELAERASCCAPAVAVGALATRLL